MSAYETYNSTIGVKLSHVLSDDYKKGKQEILMHPNSIREISYSAYEKRVQRYPEFRLRPGYGQNSTVLLSWPHLPEDWRIKLANTFGHPEAETNPLSDYFELSSDARKWYSDFAFEDGVGLTPEQINQYTVNASVLMALSELKKVREITRKARGSSLRGLWPSLITDLINFNDILLDTYNVSHTLPKSIKIKKNLEEFEPDNFQIVIDGRARNKAAKQVTPIMVQLWRDIFAGQREYKPDYSEVHRKYEAFLAGIIEIAISTQTGEVYDRTNPDFKPVTRQTVYNYQTAWENKSITFSKRSGDRQRFKADFEPYHKLIPPDYAGTLISVDDRNPPFKDETGKRIWFYNGIDVGSEAFTTWVYGDTKDGIILEFYRQMVRNYMQWGLKLPHGLEGERSLNSSYESTFLAPGAMFEKVRIEANNARGKRIEAFYRPLRYQYEKKREGWLARPFAILESNQASGHKVPQIPRNKIVEGCLRDIENWNNTLHSNQQLHPGLTRWDVFMDKQHPSRQNAEYNWNGILSGLGYQTKTTCRAGRITLQGKHRVVGRNNEVALGDDLIKILSKIEGQQITVKWLEGNDGKVMKSLVYDNQDRLVCELLGDLAYKRDTLERTPQGDRNRELTSAYVATVQGYISRGVKEINNIEIIENPQPEKPKRFVMPKIKKGYTPSERPVEILPDPLNEVENDFEDDLKTHRRRETSTAARF